MSDRTMKIMNLVGEPKNVVFSDSEDDQSETDYILVPNPEIDSDAESDDDILMPQSPSATRVENFDTIGDLLSSHFTVLQPIDLEDLEPFCDNSSNEEEKAEDEIDEDQPVQNPQKRKSDEPVDLTKRISTGSPSRFTPSASGATKTKKRKTNIPKKEYKWEEDSFWFPVNPAEDIFTAPEALLSPLEYFKLFFDDDLILLMVEQTNLYSTQVTGTSVSTDRYEVMDFLAIEVMMGLVEMSAYTDYWSMQYRYAKIADIMPLKRYQALRRYLHFVDNNDVNDDRYFKIRPVLESVRKNCLKIEQEIRNSVDEMMIPYKGKKAGSRKQYVKAKPRKWGFKMFVRCGVSGMVYDFIPYGGDDTFRNYKFTEPEEALGLSGKVVVALSESLPNPACCVLYFDNFFCSPDLVQYLRYEKGILSLGTLRSNRSRGCPLLTDKQLKQKGRGSFCQKVDNTNKVVIVKWFDNKSVMLCSSYTDAYPATLIKRYVKNKKQDKTNHNQYNQAKTDIQCPQIVKHYNTHMGGVDLADMLVALYRTGFKSHRWYMSIFSQILDICINNSWLLYRRHCQLLNNERQMKLKQFRYAVYEGLLLRNRKRGRCSDQDVVPPRKIIRKAVKLRPDDSIRFDATGHFPKFTEKGRCRHCTQGQTIVICEKCDIRLCFVQNRNCFYDYHNK